MGKDEGAKPLQNIYFPLSFEGEGDTGGKVDKQKEYQSHFYSSLIRMINLN